MSEAAFAVDSIRKSFGEVRALDGVTLSFPSGESTVLLGPSGCGKSTLLKSLNGLVEPDRGTVSFAGARLAESELLETRRRIGYVIQSGGLFPHLTARQNVALPGRLAARPTTDERLTELAALVRLEVEMLDRYPQELSGGQRQRVGLMRALVLDPEALLLDEPMGALDPMTRAELQRDLRGIFRTLSKTVVLVTHDLAEARFLGDVIVLMRDGRVVQTGSYDELSAAPADAFVEQFFAAQRQLHGGAPS